MRSNLFVTRSLAVFSLCLLPLLGMAEEPNVNSAAATAQTDPQLIDRDGKRICGYELMSDSERGGYKNIMHQTKVLEDRDAIRVDHCARMKARAKERGVATEE